MKYKFLQVVNTAQKRTQKLKLGLTDTDVIRKKWTRNHFLI